MSTGTNIERITENNGIINDNNADLVTLKNRINNLPDTSTATATAGDIVLGKTAFVNGNQVTGTCDWKNIEWQPQLDWWDIDTILANDTEDYAGKFICLLSDSKTIGTYTGWGATKVVTSDGTTYQNPSDTFEHTWDTSYDKPCSLGYKTRYIIYYFSNNIISREHQYTKLPPETLYCTFKNMNITITNQNWANGIFNYRYLLQYINFINTTFTYHPTFYACRHLIGHNNFIYNGFSGDRIYASCNLIKEKCINGKQYNNCAYLLSGCRNIKNLDIDISNVTNLSYSLSECGVQIIETLNFNNATNVSNMFNQTNSLITIKNVSNIKITGLNFSTCYQLNHDTLVRILNALYDYSESTATHTLTIGTDNLNKLTAEEKAIATRKRLDFGIEYIL